MLDRLNHPFLKLGGQESPPFFARAIQGPSSLRNKPTVTGRPPSRMLGTTSASKQWRRRSNCRSGAVRYSTWLNRGRFGPSGLGFPAAHSTEKLTSCRTARSLLFIQAIFPGKEERV